MPIDAIKSVLRTFVGSSKAEVCALKGKWGVGKTYFWNKTLNDAILANEVHNERYAYVSLFGIMTLDQLKNAIFEQTLPIKNIGSGTTFESFRKNVNELGERLGRKAKQN